MDRDLRTYDAHDLRIVDTYLKQSSKNILTKDEFCKMMEYGVFDSKGGLLIEGYHFKEKLQKEAENTKLSKGALGEVNGLLAGPLNNFYTPAWVQLRRRIKGPLWQYLSEHVEISTELGPHKALSRTNSYTYRYREDGFSMLDHPKLSKLLDPDSSPRLPKRKKDDKNKISGRDNRNLRGTADIERRINEVLKNAHLDLEKEERLKTTFVSALSSMKDQAKHEINSALEKVSLIIETHPDNWKEDCQKILVEAKERNKLLKDDLEYADFLWSYATFLVVYDIYEGAQEIFDQALDIYNRELRFSCPTDQFVKYISIYDSISNLTYELRNFSLSQKYVDDGIRVVGSRCDESEELRALSFALRNRKVMILYCTERVEEAVTLAKENLANAKKIHDAEKSLFTTKQMMLAYWHICLCAFGKAETTKTSSDWRDAWTIIDEADDFAIEAAKTYDNSAFQYDAIRLLILKSDFYRAVTTAIYPNLSRDDWNKIHSFDSKRLHDAFEVVKKYNDLNSDGTPNFSKAVLLEQLTQAIFDAEKNLYPYFVPEVGTHFFEADQYVLETYIIFADLYFPVYGRRLGWYFATSVEYYVEWVQLMEVENSSEDDAEGLFSIIVGCVERVISALAVANDVNDEEFSSMVRASTQESYIELHQLFEELNLFENIKLDANLDFYVWMFFLEAYKFSCYDDEQKKVPVETLEHMQKKACEIIEVAQKILDDYYMNDPKDYEYRNSALGEMRKFFVNLI